MYNFIGHITASQSYDFMLHKLNQHIIIKYHICKKKTVKTIIVIMTNIVIMHQHLTSVSVNLNLMQLRDYQQLFPKIICETSENIYMYR